MATTRGGDVLVLTPELRVEAHYRLGIALQACAVLDTWAVCGNALGQLVVVRLVDKGSAT